MRADPFYFSEGPYHAVLQGVYQALAAPEVFVKITGERGTGKTLLLEKLSQFLAHKGFNTVFFDYPFESPESLREDIATRLNLPETFNFARQMEERLQSADAPPQRLVLLFDACHQYNDATLLEMYRLTHIQQDENRMLSIVMCAEPSLDARLMSEEKFRPIIQHVSHSFILSPMDKESLTRFFLGYFRSIDRPGMQLDPQAMSLFQRFSHGLPGLASTLCEQLALAYAQDVEQHPVNREEFLNLVRQSPLAAEYLRGNRLFAANRLMVMGPVAAVLVLLSMGLLYRMSVAPPPVEPGPVLAAVDVPTTVPEDAPAVTPAPSAVAEPEPAASPFVDEQPQPPAPPVGRFTLDDVEEPIIDAGLALVTALERGISLEQLSAPVYEPLDTLQDSPVEIAEPAPASSQSEPAVIAEVEPADTAIAPAVLPPDDNVQSEPEPVVVAEVEPAETVVAPAVPTAGDNSQPESEPVEIAVAEPVVTPAVTAAPEEPLVEVPRSPALVAGETASEAVLESAVTAWVEAWQSQDLQRYFARYHTQFEPRYQDTTQAWQQNRRRNIESPPWIRLAVSEFQVIATSQDDVEVNFWLAYESPTYSDNTLKKLVLRRSGDDWLIVEEINLEVRR